MLYIGTVHITVHLRRSVRSVSCRTVRCGAGVTYYTGCPRRNVPDFGRVFRMLKYTDITQNTYVQS